VFDLDFESLFDAKNKPKINHNNVIKENKNEAKNNVKHGENTNNKIYKKSKGSMDDIDLILSAEKRIMKNFYFDPDILEVIENVPKKKRSDLINTCLRKVFHEKGLL
ncbi:hypothetical protein SB677_19440, partial [Bacillus sp. SIMBA_033]